MIVVNISYGSNKLLPIITCPPHNKVLIKKIRTTRKREGGKNET